MIHIALTAFAALLEAIAIAGVAFAADVDCNAWHKAVSPLFEKGKNLPEMTLLAGMEWADEVLKVFDEAKAIGCVGDPVEYAKERTEIVTLRLELKDELARRIGKAGEDLAKENLHP